MTTNTYSYPIEMSKGPYTGKLAAHSKGWVARIEGTDAEMVLKREFLRGKADSDAPFRKAKCTWNDVYELQIGLYETLEGGSREFMVVFAKDGQLKCIGIDADRAHKMAALMDDGMDCEAARLATRAQQ